jgi:predicted ATP-dependent serine protease
MLEVCDTRVWAADELVNGVSDADGGLVYTTGFRFLDRHLGGGYVPGDTWVVAGRTSAGKSHAALAKLAGMARAGVPAVYLSLKELLGELRHEVMTRTGDAETVQVHTKCVPDRSALPRLRREQVVALVERSLRLFASTLIGNVRNPFSVR